MTFGTIAILSLLYCLIGARVLYQVVRSWRLLWDATFTPSDRLLITQAAFFLLVPISVALHELGHAVAIWSFGGRVTDFGYYLYAGYVGYREPFTATQQTIVAAAGSAVNLLLCAAALLAALAKRPHLRAPINELLVQFALISGINAFVIYPLLDFASSLQGGDFHQMYSFDAPAVSTAILIVHIAVLVFGVWALRSRSFRARVNDATERMGQPAPRQVIRRPVDLRFARPAAPFAPDSAAGRATSTLHDAAARVADGWQVPVQWAVVPAGETSGAAPTGVALFLRWTSQIDHRPRQVVAQSPGGTSLRVIGQSGEMAPSGADAGSSPRTAFLGTEGDLPGVDALVVQLRMAMETVEHWQESAAQAGLSGPTARSSATGID